LAEKVAVVHHNAVAQLVHLVKVERAKAKTNAARKNAAKSLKIYQHQH
jgi:3-methyladenine DNA glycosylase Tag